MPIVSQSRRSTGQKQLRPKKLQPLPWDFSFAEFCSSRILALVNIFSRDGLVSNFSSTYQQLLYPKTRCGLQVVMLSGFGVLFSFFFFFFTGRCFSADVGKKNHVGVQFFYVVLCLLVRYRRYLCVLDVRVCFAHDECVWLSCPSLPPSGNFFSNKDTSTTSNHGFNLPAVNREEHSTEGGIGRSSEAGLDNTSTV